MDSQDNFSQLFTQLSQAFSSVGYKTHSLELLDPNYMSQEEFNQQIQSLSSEIPFLNTILKYKNLFTLFPQIQFLCGFMMYNQISHQFSEQIGVGANSKVFINTYYNENFAVKTMKNIYISSLQYNIQECVNQYNLIQINKNCILNFKGQVYISIFDNYANLYIPLELAEYSLYEYIQNNEITSEIYQYFYNFLIDLLVLLHSNNYAHRDIKPQNILFIKGIGWKLADFGESIKYEQIEGLYQIQGTVAFLPEEIRKQINRNKEIHQNLYKNDIYAVICTLVMIKNPQFNSKDLINYMDTQILDQDLQNLQLTLNQDNPLQLLLLLKVSKLGFNIEIFTCIQKDFNFNVDCTIYQFLQIKYQISKNIDEENLNLIDALLKKLLQDQQFDEHKKLQLYVTLLFPFQLHQLKNFNQSELDHNLILSKSRFFLNEEYFKQVYLSTFIDEETYVNFTLNKELNIDNLYIIFKFIKDYLIVGKIDDAQEILNIFGIIIFFSFLQNYNQLDKFKF